ncbi:MAG: ATP-binding protein [Hyphomonadaceae bacterium]
MDVALIEIAAPQRSPPEQISLRTDARARSCNVCDLVLEADHRIANHLAMVSGYVRLKEKSLARQPDAPTRDSVKLAFEGIRAQIDAVARLHRSLATRKQGGRIDLGEYIHHVCAPFMSGLSGQIELTEDLQAGCLVQSDDILPMTQIASEVITNAIKYSHVRGETGKLLVRCRSAPDGQLEMDITDDGTGLPQLLDPSTSEGIGFRLIRALTAQIGAESGFESSVAGTRFWLRMTSARQGSERP